MKTPVRSFLITAVLTLATVSGFLPGSTVIAQVGTPSVSPAAEPTKPVQEPLTIQRFPSYYHSQQPLTPEPEIILRFSGPVSEKAVKEAASFTDSKSERSIPVKVSRPNAEAIKEIQPWGDDGNRLALSADHFVMVKPITELPTSVSWVLRLEAPLASIDGKRTLAATWRENLGTLYPFTVRSTNGVNRYDEANFIQINLSKVVHDEITEEILAGFLKIQPEPKNFGIKKSYQTIQLSGDFENGRTYEVTVFPGLKAYDETQLVAQVKSKVVFTPNPGFVTLPAFSKVQNASGAKRFDILTGNLKGLRVRVKQLSDRDLVYALRGYDELYDGYGGKQKIPFEMVAGRTIFDQEFKRTAKIDDSEKISLDWAKILQNESNAALYICAEGWSETKKDLGVGAQAIIQLTDIGLSWKQDRDETLIYAFSLRTGKPLAKLNLESLDAEAEPTAEFKTDDLGMVRIPRKRLDDAKWLAASRGKDRHIVETFGRYDAVGLWQFAIPYRYDELEETERRTLLFTDRGVYKPGDTVHVKCLSRLADGDRLLPVAQAAGRASVKVTDPRGRTLFSDDIDLSAHGSFDFDFELPEEQGLGWHTILVDFNDPKKEVDSPWQLRFQQGFQVAEYRPNTFEIAIDTESAAEEAVNFKLPVSAKYYMGKPLSKARLTWQVSAYPSWPQVRGFGDFRFGDSTRDRDSFSASETLELTETGEGDIAFALPESNSGPTPMRVHVSAEITDLNQQTIAESSSFLVDSSDFYLGVRAPESLVRVGEEAKLGVAAVSPDGKVHQAPVEANLLVEKITYTSVKVRAAGGRITNRTESEMSEVMSLPITIETKIQPDTGLPQADEVSLRLEEAGDYQLTLATQDEQGREVLTRTRLRIIGAEEPAWSWHDGIRIDLTPDKENYAIGDVAKLLVRTPVLGHALITTERAGVRETRSERITEHETVIEVPITPGSAPNLFASILIVRGAADSPHEHPNTDYRLGYCQLLVDDPAAALTVVIEKNDVPYQLPGAKVTLGAKVASNDGEPVEGAEVTLYAVDEGVLSLTGYEKPNPAGTFHQPFPLAVHTGQSISDLLPESPLEQQFDNKGYVIGGGGEMDGVDPTRVRKNFKALAFWSGALISDADGKVTTTFEAPDNLTSYRIIAVVAEENRFASVEDRLVINKPLIIEPSLPAFGNVGDRMDLSAILHNNTENAIELEIRAELDRHAEFLPEAEGLVPTSLTKTDQPDSGDLRVRRLTLAGGETNKVSFPALFSRMGEATWRWQATDVTNAKLTDAVESKLEIGYPMPLLRETHSYTLKRADKSENLVADVDPRLLSGRGEVKVTVSNSRVLEALDALDYLLHYPYGCVEQTTSSTLPWLSTQQLHEALPQLNRSDAEIRGAIAAGMKRLLSMQTANGGLSYWPGGKDPILWGSAYGGMALAMAERQGVELPKERLAALWTYLSEQLRDTAKQTNRGDLYNRSLAAYTLALAGKAEPSYHELLYGKRKQLSGDSRALLALAMMETAGKELDDTLKERVGNLLAPDPEEEPEGHSHWYRSHFRTSMELLAWSQWDALNDRTATLLDDLLGVPKGRAAWGSTYLNSWGMLALSKHAEATASALEDTVCTVKFGDESREVVFGKLFAGELLTFEFDADKRSHPLEVSLDSPGRIYAHVEVAAQPEIVPTEPENHGLGIERTYHHLTQDGKVEPIDSLEVGDLVLVTLHLSIPQDRKFHNLAIDDPLPSVFEAVNPNFETQVGAGQNAFHGDWKRLYCNYRELRTERALFFCDYVYRGGDYAVQYLARVVAPGEVTAPAAKVEAMYEPQIYGLSRTLRVTATPLKLRSKKQVAQR